MLATDPEEVLSRYPSFEHVLELIRANRDVKLLLEVEGHIRLANYRPGRIEFSPTPDAPGDLAQRLGSALQRWTGNRWAVTLVNSATAPTILEARNAAKDAAESDARQHPLVQAVFAAFPRAKIARVKTEKDIASHAETEALPEVDEEWDPFEED